jgi:hypothetical protein
MKEDKMIFIYCVCGLISVGFEWSESSDIKEDFGTSDIFISFFLWPLGFGWHMQALFRKFLHK